MAIFLKNNMVTQTAHTVGLTEMWLIYAISLLYGESLGTVELFTIHKEVLPSGFLLLVFVDKTAAQWASFNSLEALCARLAAKKQRTKTHTGWEEWLADLRLRSIPRNCKRLKDLYIQKSLIKLNTEDSTIFKKVKNSKKKKRISTLNLSMTVSSIQPKKKKKVDQSIPEVLESLSLC